MYKNEDPTSIHGQLLAFYGENTMDVSTVYCTVIKLRQSGGNLHKSPKQVARMNKLYSLGGILLHHNSARPHHTVSSVLTDFKLLHTPHNSLDLAPSNFWFLQYSSNISNKLISHVMKK
jgi:hypothetical protein